MSDFIMLGNEFSDAEMASIKNWKKKYAPVCEEKSFEGRLEIEAGPENAQAVWMGTTVISQFRTDDLSLTVGEFISVVKNDLDGFYSGGCE